MRAVLALVFSAVLSFTCHAAEVRVFAAASLKNALDEIAAQWEARATNRKVTAVYAASSALAQQIMQAAPADVFISADEKWMDELQSNGFIDEASRFNLAGNTLVLIAPADSTARVDLADPTGIMKALGAGKLAVADVKAVPAGRYARAALEKLGVFVQVEPNLAQAENVRAALALVARGEAPLGIVYGSDALEETGVKVLAELPADTGSPIVYPAARVKTSTSSDATAFLEDLKSSAARAILASHGFTPPPT
jgi:molybdate transport system substrate-binding protein